MGAYYFYHNITKMIFNETDIEDLVSRSNEDDKIVVTTNGDAIVRPLDLDQQNEIEEKFKLYKNG